MTKYLVSHFIKNYKETEKAKVRTAYGTLAGVVGIIANFILFVVKLFCGLFAGSISIMADAFNNLSDMASSVISVAGIKMAERPADEEHPFGHGRVEYIAALIVSFLILQVGLSLFKESFKKIRKPENLSFSLFLVVILLLSIGVKLWLSFFNKQLGSSIHSKVIEAASKDALGDVVVTTGTLASLLFFRLTDINIDGIVGIVVSLVVFWNGIGVARDTISPLIGEAISYKDYQKITRFVDSFKGVIGSHDLLIHQYGPEKSMASIHVEIPNHYSMEESHEIVDEIEREALDKLGITLVIHTDPVETKDQIVLKTRKQVMEVIKDFDSQVTVHDFHLSYCESGKINLVFDITIPYEYSKEKEEFLEKRIKEKLKQIDDRYHCMITIDRSFVKGI